MRVSGISSNLLITRETLLRLRYSWAEEKKEATRVSSFEPSTELQLISLIQEHLTKIQQVLGSKSSCIQDFLQACFLFF